VLVVTWVVQSQGIRTVVSHHWFATAASMASAVALLSALASVDNPAIRAAALRTRRDGAAAWLLAGLFAGIAAMTMPPQGAFLCLAALGLATTCPDRRRAIASVVGGAAVFPLASLAYLGATGSMAAAFYDTIVFPLRHYGRIEGVTFGAFAETHQLPAVVFLQLTFLLAGLAAVLERQALWREPVFRGALALAVVAVPSVFPRPDVTHINFVLPLACPMFTLATQRLLRRLERPTRRGRQRRAGRARRRDRRIRVVHGYRADRHRPAAPGLHGARRVPWSAVAVDRGGRGARARDRAHAGRRRVLLLPAQPDAALSHRTPARRADLRDGPRAHLGRAVS